MTDLPRNISATEFVGLAADEQRFSAKKGPALRHDLDGNGPSRVQGTYAPIRKYKYFGYAIIFMIFGVGGAWSALAPLDSAVIAQGLVTVESNRKTVQHLEGGIVEEIGVMENRPVRTGDLLLRLRETQASATAEVYRHQLEASRATEARLEAEQARADSVVFAERLFADHSSPLTQRLINDQTAQFRERRASIVGQINIIESRIEQLQREIEGLTAQRSATERQIESMDGELNRVRGLAERGFYPLNRILAMERDMTQLQGRQGQILSEIAKSEKAIGEAQLQKVQIEQKFQEEVIQNLRDVRVQIAELEEKVRVSSEVLSRVEIRSPIDGVVQNLRVHTVGGVVRPGEPIMEIVPTNERLIIQAKISPLDINYVTPNMKAEIRFPSFKSRNNPIIEGNVLNISRDILFDEASKVSYYQALVVVADHHIPPQYQGKLTPGMPADIVIPTGERTFLEYIVTPLSDTIRKSLREH